MNEFIPLAIIIAVLVFGLCTRRKRTNAFSIWETHEIKDLLVTLNRRRDLGVILDVEKKFLKDARMELKIRESR